MIFNYKKKNIKIYSNGLFTDFYDNFFKKTQLRPFFYILLFLIFIIFLQNPAGAQQAASSTSAGEQRFAEKGLKDNRYFIYYLNSTITNTGTEEDKNAFADIIKRDIVSQFFYMRFMFAESFDQVRIVQENLITLYHKKLNDEINVSLSLLNILAAETIQSKDSDARQYLRLGYRNIRSAKIEIGMADAFKPSLYSMRLHKYIRAMKQIKEAKRFAILILIQNNLPPEEKLLIKKYNFDIISDYITKFSPENMLTTYELNHSDSYYRYYNGISFFDMIWEKPDLENYDVFKDYLEKSE